ncbi:MAG: L-threonylcarbamoyladenylate synthase [Candidatus Marsarchaeota archaeon]|nr:L-threonylcarbamoyladenylate synthase [Candidatus Marsarchaeota archaeon]
MQLVVYPPLARALQHALAHSRAGGVVVYPTDTLYGLGGDATNAAVVSRVILLKARPADQPLSILFSDWASARDYIKMDAALEKKLGELTPGPFTFLLPLKNPLPVTSSHLVGCRIPQHEFCLKWAAAFGKPIITTSANKHKMSPPRAVEELDASIIEGVDLIVDGGPSKDAVGSTIIDVPNKRILREGAGLQKAKEWLKKL